MQLGQDSATLAKIRHLKGQHRVASASLAAALVCIGIFPGGQIQLMMIIISISSVAYISLRVVVPMGNLANESVALLERAEKRHLSEMRHDPVTGLPTRKAMLDILDMSMNHANRHGNRLGLCVFYIDNLREINELYGHDAGDLALRRAAGVIRTETRKGDYVARIAEYEFVVISNITDSDEDLTSIAERIEARLAAPQIMDEHELKLKCFVGVVRAEAHDVDADRLLLDSAIALHAARAQDRSVMTFSEELRNEFNTDLKDRSELAQGLKSGQIEPWYQPQIDALTGELVGVEALARWHHPDRGILGPGAFFPVAREFGLMDDIDKTILDQSLNALKQWRSEGTNMPRVCVNISAARLEDPYLAEEIKWSIEKYDLNPSDLSIEILESAMITSADCDIAKNIGSLSRIGVHLDLDDFGTGHAAISTLHNIEVDRIKIDRSFVTNIDSDERRQKNMRAMLDLAQSFQVLVLAEGIENEAEKSCVTELGCQQLQGFGIAHPMPRERVVPWIEEQASKRAFDAALPKTA